MKEEYLQSVQSLDDIINTMYNTISGPAGKKIDWELFKLLFHKEAKLIPSGKNNDGAISCRYLSPLEYITSAGQWLEENSFYEKEISRITETFGTLTHVFSTYESRKEVDDTTPFMRGINSLQLLYDQSRWWILNIYWTNESDQNPLPSKYL
ncbi:hypothetical protein [Fulvivirga sediminis]|uniref:Nuclear transport factor 2 family protein n=1 Tax=Fulvivirga sediminis TaxID=2803949 RepID=A0A937K0B9_9BACT|nr:hypothetical protein [Fulvivirga sediminis]MBL3657504.1 hypothetical protein [Fulvivirga sediminis]